MQNKYCISRFYKARTEYHHYDDQAAEDQWQLEVYLHVLGLMKKYKLRSVADIGCGSAFKLMTYLNDYDTLGLELPVNVELLKQRYPQRRWEVADFSKPAGIVADVVICSDVIEHLVDPDKLLEFIAGIDFKYLVLSTPDRGLLYRPWHRGYRGPPGNVAHVREWNYVELRNYISQHFEVLDHRVTNLAQGTQMMICRPKITRCSA